MQRAQRAETAATLASGSRGRGQMPPQTDRDDFDDQPAFTLQSEGPPLLPACNGQGAWVSPLILAAIEVLASEKSQAVVSSGFRTHL